MLTNMVVELKRFDVDEEGVPPFPARPPTRSRPWKAKYASAETNVNKICDVLEGHQITLMKDIAMLDKLYEINLSDFKELSMYILAGKEHGCARPRKVDLPALVAKSKESGQPEDVQAANDMANMTTALKRSSTTWSSPRWWPCRWPRS